MEAFAHDLMHFGQALLWIAGGCLLAALALLVAISWRSLDMVSGEGG